MFDSTKVKQGVRTPIHEAGNEKGPANTVRRVAKVEMLAVEYFDKGGQKHELVVIVMGGKVFVPPNTEQWLFDCKAAAPWLERLALEMLKEQQEKVTVPSMDTVDIFAPTDEVAAKTA